MALRVVFVVVIVSGLSIPHHTNHNHHDTIKRMLRDPLDNGELERSHNHTVSNNTRHPRLDSLTAHLAEQDRRIGRLSPFEPSPIQLHRPHSHDQPFFAPSQEDLHHVVGQMMSSPMQEPWTFHPFDANLDALCLDGSPAGMYLRHGSSPAGLWVLHFGGQPMCFNESSCASRANTKFGSSRDWPTTLDQPWEDVLFVNTNPQHNPFFWDANHAYIPDCSGDAWLGSGSRVPPATAPKESVFAGQHVFVASVKTILEKEHMGQTAELILGGSCFESSLGVLANGHLVEQAVAGQPHHVRVRSYAVDGWLVAHPLYSPLGSESDPVTGVVTHWASLYRPQLPDLCMSQLGEARQGLCLLGPQLYNYSTIPTFVAQPQQSAFQLAFVYGLPDTVDQDEQEVHNDFLTSYVHAVRTSLRAIDGEDDGMFAPACSTVLNSSIRKLAFEEALGLWCIGELAPALNRIVDMCLGEGCGSCNHTGLATALTDKTAISTVGGAAFPFVQQSPLAGGETETSWEAMQTYNPAQDKDALSIADSSAVVEQDIPQPAPHDSVKEQIKQNTPLIPD